MDKYITEREKYKEKGDARLAATETRLEAAITAYEDINAELKHDIPILLDHAESYFQPLILMLVVNQGNFWSSMAQFTSELSSRVDPSQAFVPEIKQIITPKGSSAVTKKYSAVGNNPWDKPPVPVVQSGYGLAPPPAITYGAPAPNPYAAPAPNPYAAPAPNPYGAPAPTQAHAGNPFPVGGQQPAHNPFTQPAVNPFATPATVSPRPPPRVPTVPVLPQARGLWDFTGQDDTELSFKAGEIIIIHVQQGEWWTGEHGGRRGLFPANYVQLL